MDCDVLGVGANNDLGEDQGVLGEEEMNQLKTQVRWISLPFLVDFTFRPASHLLHLLYDVKRNKQILQQIIYFSWHRWCLFQLFIPFSFFAFS